MIPLFAIRDSRFAGRVVRVPRGVSRVAYSAFAQDQADNGRLTNG
jgi:hypothetical protein